MLKALQLFLLPFILTVAKAGHQGEGNKWKKISNGLCPRLGKPIKILRLFSGFLSAFTIFSEYRMRLGKPIKILRLFSVSSRLSLYLWLWKTQANAT